jgi:lincosamide nucleotidyltransferase A/C/D/E
MMNPEMPAEAAVYLLRLFEGAGIDVWLDGGWAVDAALGEQTRSHKDLDIIVQISDLPRFRKVLGARGFDIKEGGTESNFVLAHSNGLEVDVHAFIFDEAGNGVYRMSNGEDWIFPASGFAGRGEILGFNVRCLSPEVQVLCHAHGYVPKKKDLRDMELLEARFGVELPSHLRRQT